jgi:hypothetical protein
VTLWVVVLLLAAFLPVPPDGDGGGGGGGDPPSPPQCVAEVLPGLIKAGKTSEEILAAVKERCKEGNGVEKLADQPAGENWLMRHRGKLKEELQRPGYKQVRERFVAVEQQQDFATRHAALRKILEIADTPIVRHRTYIEIAQSALRSGDPAARKTAAGAAAEAHKQAKDLPKEARADAHLVDAELAIREGRLKKALDDIALALESDRGYLAAHLLRLNIIVALSQQASEADKLNYLNLGIESAYFIRRLTNTTYTVDARSAIAEHPLQSDVAALLQFFLGSLGDDRDGARRGIVAFLAQCSSKVLSCATSVRVRAQALLE